MLDLPPRHGNLVIEDQIVIDKFIEEYPKTQRTKNAEENVSIKNMFHFKLNSAKLCTTCKLVLVCFLPGRLFDEKAIFESVCKHETPYRFVNLKHGERYIIFSISSTECFNLSSNGKSKQLCAI